VRGVYEDDSETPLSPISLFRFFLYFFFLCRRNTCPLDVEILSSPDQVSRFLFAKSSLGFFLFPSLNCAFFSLFLDHSEPSERVDEVYLLREFVKRKLFPFSLFFLHFHFFGSVFCYLCSLPLLEGRVAPTPSSLLFFHLDLWHPLLMYGFWSSLKHL